MPFVNAVERAAYEKRRYAKLQMDPAAKAKVWAKARVNWARRRAESPDAAADRLHRAAQQRCAARKQRKADPTWRHRNEVGRLKRTYGITAEQYEAVLSAQKHGCAICAAPLLSRMGLLRLSKHIDGAFVDHCHVTGRVRGLLCTRCNTAIGLLQENAGVIRRAADYVERAA